MSENIKNNAENSENVENSANLNENTINQTNQVPVDVSTDETETPVEVRSEIDLLLDQVNELKDKYLRLHAEFENYKRRTSKERIELMQTANKETIMTMLDVMDDINRADLQIEKSDDVTIIKEGVQLVFNKFRKVMETKGVKTMESTGKDFDVELHEAITEVPMPGMEGKVIDTTQNGYYLNEKLVRFAKVVVGK